MFNYFPLLISASFNPSFAFASSFNFPEVNNAHEDLELPMFQVKYLFLLALVFLCFILPLIKIGGGGENRTRVLKSPHRGFIFNQNPAPPLHLKSRLKVRKVIF